MMKINFINLILWIIIMFILMYISMNLNSHPVFIMIIIIIYNSMICLNMSMWKMNFMYSIMLFLILISGLLIIFLYFSSLISNEQMTFYSNKILLLSLIFNIMYMYMLFLMNKLFSNNIIYTTKEINSLNKINNKMFENILNLYIYPYNNITICSMLYLLLTLFIIIKLSNMKIKPLRKITN
uniref:NADH dehydrogenase subunit 6 n=1 Tax=Tapinoma ibericum TaxID=2005328 RepID=UPI002176A75A|nr:NADH dehydrogenase subunit 6 [Tapinoma ibericum]UUF93602.1 NADH dehydrogenase subunit 6 [Tapinoma ibericum]